MPGTQLFNVTIRRWDVYVVRDVEAESADTAEERALEIYEASNDDYEHVDGGVESVHAELAE